MAKSIIATITLCALPAVLLYTSCNSANKSDQKKSEVATQSDSSKNVVTESPKSSKGFDINSIPISNHDLGEFPFFKFPEGLAEQNKPVQKKFDILFFPIGGTMTPLEGKVWKSNVVMKSGNTDQWSLHYFEKSYDEAIKAVGGVKIFEDQISSEEYDRYHNQASYLGEDGSIGYTGEKITVYVIRRADGSDVYIQLAGNTASGKIDILQKAPVK